MPKNDRPSTTAQLVLDAFTAAACNNGGYDWRMGVAAALRAACEIAAPEKHLPDSEEWLGQSAWIQAESGVRFRFLAIAAELDQPADQTPTATRLPC